VPAEPSAWAIDLDGVIWRGDHTVPGSPEAIALLRSEGLPIAFVTNSAYRTPGEVAAKLAAHGIADAEDSVVTSAMAAATMVSAGERVLAIGSAGLLEALRHSGAVTVEALPAYRPGVFSGPARASAAPSGHDRALPRPAEPSPAAAVLDGAFDAVVVGITFAFDYSLLDAAMNAIGNGARFIATNLDPTYPVSGGVVPGNGSIVAAIATASGTEPEVAGKPAAPIARLVRSRLGMEAAADTAEGVGGTDEGVGGTAEAAGGAADSPGDTTGRTASGGDRAEAGAAAERTAAGQGTAQGAAAVRSTAEGTATGIMVGDRCDTDGMFAKALGCRFGLVFSGVTSPGDPLGGVEPWARGDDLLSLVSSVLDDGDRGDRRRAHERTSRR